MGTNMGPLGFTLLGAGLAGAVLVRQQLVRDGRRSERDPLAIYLEDHLAGSRIAIGLLGAMRKQHEGEPMEQFAAELLAEILEDRMLLLSLVEQAEHRGGRAKEATAWLAEKATHVKLQRSSAGDLGVLQGLEALALGILGKRALWRALEPIAATDERLADIDFERLAARAEAQHARVEARRIEYARRVFGAGRL